MSILGNIVRVLVPVANIDPDIDKHTDEAAKAAAEAAKAAADAAAKAAEEAAKATADAAAHAGDELTKVVDRADQGINNGWEHVKHDWGPNINQGAIEAGQFLWDGLSWKACEKEGCFQGLPTPARGPTDQLEPDVPLSDVVGSTIGALVYNNSTFNRVIEVFDAVAGLWTYRLPLGPWERSPVRLRNDDLGHGSAILRWDHVAQHDVRFSWIREGDELK